MSMKLIKRVPTGDEIKELYPLSTELKKIKAARDEEIRKVFTGEDNRFLFIIGPCSADNEEAVCDYLNRLAKVADDVKDKILVIPRIYTNKPRTTGDGYKGMLHQPDPTKASDMLEGLYAIRKMHIRAIKETGLTAADEMLYSENWQYVDDILSYVAIGARSVEDLIGEGNVALSMGVTMLDCVESIDEIDGFLAKMIMDAMEEYISDDTDSHQAGEKVLDKVNLVNDKSKEMAEELLRKVTVEELAQEMQLDEEEIREAIRLSANHMEYIEEDTQI